MKRLLLALLRFYRRHISPHTPPSCRFIPTCSQYAVEAIEKYGAAKGGWLALKRLSRCHPFHRGEHDFYDPVPRAARGKGSDAMSYVYRGMGAVLLFFYETFKSYGWAILTFGLVVKLVMLPFQMKSKQSMMRTTMLTPRVKELEKKHGANKQKYQEEVARLYREAKINPMSGCLWTLIPFPILILLYQAVRQPLTYLMSLTQGEVETLTEVTSELGFYAASARDAYAQMGVANALHEHFQAITSNAGVAEFADKLRDISFNFLSMNLTRKPWGVWEGEDLSGGVRVWLPMILMLLIPFISAGLTLLQTKLSQKMSPPQDAQSAQTTKTMNMVMPLTSIWICFIMPVAMGLYWIEQSVLGIIQEAILNRHYKKKLDAEMSEFLAAERKREEELERKRAETERLKAEGKTQVNASTSKKRLAAQERNAAEQRQAAIRAADRAARGLIPEKPASQVDNRRYARGRAYDPDRFAGEAAAAEAAAEEAAAETATEEAAAAETAAEAATEVVLPETEETAAQENKEG